MLIKRPFYFSYTDTDVPVLSVREYSQQLLTGLFIPCLYTLTFNFCKIDIVLEKGKNINKTKIFFRDKKERTELGLN